MRALRTVIPTALLVLSILCAEPSYAAIGALEWLDKIDEQEPDVIMVGNSMQWRGIDFAELSKQSGAKVTGVSGAGAMSAWKYCVLRYLLPRVRKTPKAVIVVTRMNFITSPQKRMGIRIYQKRMEKVTGADRKLLKALAFDGEGQPEWDSNWDTQELPPPDSYYWDFERAVKTSFLPHMIEAARKDGYKLVIARYKSRKYAEEPNWEPPEVKKYGKDLAAYLEANGVVFLDYVHHPEIRIEHYEKGDHLNQETGKPIWTRAIAKDLKAILAGKRAPNQRPRSADAKGKKGVKPAATQPASTEHSALSGDKHKKN